MQLNKKKWRFIRHIFPHKETGETIISEQLVSPDYYTPCDYESGKEGYEARYAIPTKPKGKFFIKDNGYGTIQIFNEDNNFFLPISYYEVNDKKRMTPEEALWCALTIMEKLNE